jgi:hypothetical protein
MTRQRRNAGGRDNKNKALRVKKASTTKAAGILGSYFSAHFLEHKPYYKEIRWYGDAIHRHGGQGLADTKPNEKVQQADLQQVVEQVSPTETYTVFHRLFLAESETRRKHIIEHETDEIPQSVSHVDVHQVMQQPINSIMQGCGNHAYHPEAHKLKKRFSCKQHKSCNFQAQR